jgi:hypothetical protein
LRKIAPLLLGLYWDNGFLGGFGNPESHHLLGGDLSNSGFSAD